MTALSVCFSPEDQHHEILAFCLHPSIQEIMKSSKIPMVSTRFHGTCHLSLITKSAGLMIWAVYFFYLLAFASPCQMLQVSVDAHPGRRVHAISGRKLTRAITVHNRTTTHTRRTMRERIRKGRDWCKQARGRRQQDRLSNTVQKMDCHHQRRECCLVEEKSLHRRCLSAAIGNIGKQATTTPWTMEVTGHQIKWR
jgi:hypothetical protein